MLTIAPGSELVLASASPRRCELLRGCGLEFLVVPSSVDETPIPGEAPQAMVRRLAEEKARAVARLHPGAWVLGADTTVVLGEKVLGKPSDEKEAFEMLSSLQGQVHEVWGGFSIVRLSSGHCHVESHRSEVRMVPLSPAEIEAYIDTREPMDKAGSYAIQGVGAHLVSSVVGSYTNVVGLDLAATIRALRAAGALSGPSERRVA